MHLTNPVHFKRPAWKRAIASTLTAALAVTGAAILAAPAASAATPATQNIDVTLSYTCNVFVGESKPVGVPTFTNQSISSETIETIPASVTAGQKIPATPVKIVNNFTGLLDSAHQVNAVSASGGSPDLASTFVINDKPNSVPINNVTAPLSQIPAGDPAPPFGTGTATWFDTATGTVAPVTVPKTASGDILVQGPSNFTILSNLSASTNGSNSFPTVLACTQVQGEDLDIARIHVAPAGAQSIDATVDYTCDTWGQNGSPAPTVDSTLTSETDSSAEIKLSLPSAVAPGATIPAENITLTHPLNPALTAVLIAIEPGGLLGGLDGSGTGALGVSVNGQNTSSSFNNMTIPLTSVPDAPPMSLVGSGQTTPIIIPANAAGQVTINAPQHFILRYAVEPSATATAQGITSREESQVTEFCAADDPTSLSLATIQVTPPAANSALTATAPKATLFGRPATVPVSVKATAAAVSAPQVGGSQSIDALDSYTCDLWENQTSVPTDPSATPPTFPGGTVTLESTLTLPQSVRSNDTIPAADVTTTLGLPSAFTGTFDPFLNTLADAPAGVDNLNLTGAALGVTVGGQTSTSALPLGDAASQPGWTTVAEIESNSVWLLGASGSSSAITVPANASGDLTISAPQQFDATFTVEPPTDPDTNPVITTPIPTAMQCTAATSTPAVPTTVATINVIGSATPKPAALPSGKVLITRNGKGVAQGTLSGGRVTVTIPGTALPVGKSTLKVSYPGDSNTLAAPSKTVTVVKTKATPSLAVHVTPARVPAGAIFPTVNVKLSGPGKALGGKITVTVGSVHKTANLLFDGSGSVQLPPFASAGRKLIRVAYAGNANFVAKTVTTGLNVTKTKLGKFVVKIKPARIIAKKTRATLLITLGAPDKLGHGLVTIRMAGHVLAKKLITGTGKITLPKFSSAGRKLLHLTFTGNGSVVAKTITKAVKVTKAPKHHRK